MSSKNKSILKIYILIFYFVKKKLNININIKKNKIVNCIELYKSNIKLNKKVFLLSEKSKVNYI